MVCISKKEISVKYYLPLLPPFLRALSLCYNINDEEKKNSLIYASLSPMNILTDNYEKNFSLSRFS